MLKKEKTALITGVNGQDGSYLTELLLSKNYNVIGVYRRSSTNTLERVSHIRDDNFVLEEGDVTDSASVTGLIAKYQPDEVYNLAAQSHVATSFKQPSFTFQVNAVGVLNLLEAIRTHSPNTRFYQASTSEMFGSNFTQRAIFEDGQILTDSTVAFTVKNYQNENTPLSPNSPYAVAKVAAHNLVKNYRDSYNIYASCGILFNHESERRGENFVTRKITRWIGEFKTWRDSVEGELLTNTACPNKIFTGKQNEEFPKLRLGNLDAYRDWGHAEDYVYAMWLMLQQEVPDDYVIATGETHSVRDFLDEAFKYIGIEDWSNYVVVDPKFYRPCDVEYLLGDSAKAQFLLGWKPKVTFKELVKRMVEADAKETAKA